MKILYLCPDLGIPVLGRKGAAVHVREMVSALSRAGHEVVLASQLLNKSAWEKPAELPTPVLQILPSLGAATVIPALKAFNSLLGVENTVPGEIRRILYNQDLESELRRRFENEPPHFIYERGSIYGTAGVSLARHLGCPLILELNAPLAVEQTVYRATGLGELAAQAERWTLQHANAVVVVSSLLRDHVLALGVDASQIHVLPNGVDPARFRPAPPDPAVRARWGLDSDLVVGFVGGLRPWHGVDVLPQLFERLAEHHPKVRLVVAGDGPLLEQLERALEQRRLRSRAVLTGLLPHEEIPKVIQQLDVAVAPYARFDHDFYFSPLKIFEYMACGIPTVAANLGQIPDVIKDGQTGLLYAAGDFEELASRCELLLSDAELRRKIGQNAADHVRSHFTWDQNAKRITQLANACASRP